MRHLVGVAAAGPVAGLVPAIGRAALVELGALVLPATRGHQ